MVSLTCSATRESGVTLVTGSLTNPDRPRHVRVANRLDGPVWPPRRQGVPVAGWSEERFEARLAADETRPLGYASPAPPVEEPMAVTACEPADTDEDGDFEPAVAVPSVEATPDGVVRALGPARPPRDAVPVPDSPDPDGTAADAVTDRSQQPAEAGRSDPAAEAGRSQQPAEVGRSEPAAGVEQSGQPAGVTQSEQSGQPAAVDVWFDAVERRVASAEALSSSARLATVVEALSAVGGLQGARDLQARLDDDEAALRELAARAERLADRADRTAVAVEHLERFA
jgi:hypothetical protein